MDDNVPIPREVRTQLRQILQSKIFAGSPIVSSLLKRLVDSALDGEPATETSLSSAVWNRQREWTALNDSLVRSNMRNLRIRLERYYDTLGQEDSVIIELFKGYEPRWRYNPLCAVRANPPGSFGLDFFSALEEYFSEDGDVGLRCVVTGEPAEWHLLDGELLNKDIGNLIPLCGRISSHIARLKTGKRKTNLPELDPGYLAEELAPRYFREWRISRAYGCARLAFCMGEPPYGQESHNKRLLRLCDALYYARCRHNGHLFEYMIRTSFLPFLSTEEALDPIVAHRLMLELTPLLMESGHLDAAGQWLELSDSRIVKPFESHLQGAGRLSTFAHLRRKAELIYNVNPDDRAFEEVRRKAQEHVNSNVNSYLALEFITATRWMRQASRDASRRIFETVMPLVDGYKSTVFGNTGIFKSNKTNVAGLLNLALVCGIAACRLRPTGWEDIAGELFGVTARLQQMSGHRLTRRFWLPALRETAIQNPGASQLLKTSVQGFAGGPESLARREFDGLFRCLRRTHLRPDSTA